MPNWCYNSVYFTCPDTDTCKKLVESLESKKLFSTFSPLTITLDGSGNETWNVIEAYEKWGTKWEACEIEIIDIDDDKMEIHVLFETAWAPPLSVYNTMYQSHRISTSAFYYENGQEFFGNYEVGKLYMINNSYEYPSNKEELNKLRPKIGMDLDDVMSCEWERLEEIWEEEQENDIPLQT